MGRQAYTDLSRSADQVCRHPIAGPENQGDTTGPEPQQRFSIVRNRLHHPIHVVDAGQQHQQRLMRRATLDGKHPANRFAAARIGPEAVKPGGGEHQYALLSEDVSRRPDVNRIRRQRVDPDDVSGIA